MLPRLEKAGFLPWQSSLVIKTQVLWHLESDSSLVSLPKKLSFACLVIPDTERHFSLQYFKIIVLLSSLFKEYT